MEQQTPELQPHNRDGSLTLDNLPFDIKDDILSSIDATSDLLHLALSSKEWASMVIPNHIEYRDLKFCVNRSTIWQHLAARADLVKNVHTIRIMTQVTNSGERFPSTLTNFHANLESPPLEDPSPEMFRALSNFKSLQRFSWIGYLGPSVLLDSVFKALVRCQDLQEVKLWQVPSRLEDHLTRDSSVWKLSSLRKLCLVGTVWAMLEPFKDSFISMIGNSPNLEDLSISYYRTAPVFVACHIPLLVRLYLYPEYGVSIPGQNFLGADPSIADFLVTHPTIEDLRWYPIDQVPIPNGFLPRLKSILTNHRTAVAILRDPSLIQQRKMELISQISLGPNTMQLLETIDGSKLQELRIWRIDEGLDKLRRVAALFPNIRTLVIPTFGNPFGHTNSSGSFDECIDCLASFPALENIRESSLWFAIQTMKGEDKLDAPLKLATRCRSLKILNYYSSSTRLDHDIIFERTGSKITWSERVNTDDEVDLKQS